MAHSGGKRKNWPMMRRASSVLMAALAAGVGVARAGDVDVRPTGRPVCLTPAETREEIKTLKLVEPFHALKSAQTQFKAEPVSAKLCRLGDELIYEIALLHKDGRFVHVVMNAATGKWIELRRVHEPAAKP